MRNRDSQGAELYRQDHTLIRHKLNLGTHWPDHIYEYMTHFTDSSLEYIISLEKEFADEWVKAAKEELDRRLESFFVSFE